MRAFRSIRVTALGVRAEHAGSVVLEHADPERARNPLLTRVYLAHDLCHVLFDVSSGGVHLVVDQATHRRLAVDEQRARGFAAGFLLPDPGLQALLGPPQKVAVPTDALELVTKARSHFGTPHQIAANHLCNRGFVDDTLQEWLEASTTPFAGTPPTTDLPEPGGPSRWVGDAIRDASEAGLVTDSEAREALGLDRLAPLPWDTGT